MSPGAQSMFADLLRVPDDAAFEEIRRRRPMPWPGRSAVPHPFLSFRTDASLA